MASTGTGKEGLACVLWFWFTVSSSGSPRSAPGETYMFERSAPPLPRPDGEELPAAAYQAAFRGSRSELLTPSGSLQRQRPPQRSPQCIGRQFLRISVNNESSQGEIIQAPGISPTMVDMWHEARARDTINGGFSTDWSPMSCTMRTTWPAAVSTVMPAGVGTGSSGTAADRVGGGDTGLGC